MSEELKQLDESIELLETNEYSADIIQDNKLIFIFDNKTYRVRMPLQIEQSLLDVRRNSKQLELLRNPDCISKKNLIQLLKEKGIINIEEVEKNKEKLVQELKQQYFNLALKASDNTKEIEKYKQKIGEIRNELKELAIEIANALIPSLENNLEKFCVEYTTFLCTEILIGENTWKKLWETEEDFNKTDSCLVNKAITYMTWLLLNTRT